MLRATASIVLLSLALVQTASCGCCSDSGPSGGVIVPGNALPAFQAPDVNSTSATYQSPVSPRDHVGRISAWYFGHAT